MSLTVHDVGDSRRITATFNDIDGNLADPTTITFKMMLPDGTITTYVYLTDAEVVRESLGVFYVDWVFAVKGHHRASFQGTGAVEAGAAFECYAKPTLPTL